MTSFYDPRHQGVEYRHTPDVTVQQIQDLLTPTHQITPTPAQEATMTETATPVLSVAELSAKVDALSNVVQSLNERLDAAERARQAIASKHEAFRTQVRDLVIELGNDHGFDINEVLEGLDLEPVTTEFDVEVTVTATQTVTIKVEATSDDEARRLVEEGDYDQDVEDKIDRELDSYSWNVEKRDVEYVSEA